MEHACKIRLMRLFSLLLLIILDNEIKKKKKRKFLAISWLVIMIMIRKRRSFIYTLWILNSSLNFTRLALFETKLRKTYNC